MAPPRVRTAILLWSHQISQKAQTSPDKIFRVLWYCSSCSSDLTEKQRQAQAGFPDCYGTVATACQISQKAQTSSDDFTFCIDCSKDLTEKRRQSQTSLPDCYGNVAAARQIWQKRTYKHMQAVQPAMVL